MTGYELIFNTESLTVGQHYRLCVDFDGIGAVQGFGAVGIVYLSDTLASVTTALPFGATTAELQLSCPACTSSSSLMLALDCGDRVDVTNAASSLGVVSSSFAALSGTSWSAHFDTTTLTPGIQYHLCLDLDGTTGSLALGTTGFMVYVTPVTECWRRPSAPGSAGGALPLVGERGGDGRQVKIVGEVARGGFACFRSLGTDDKIRDVSWEQEENSFEATLSHWSHLFVAVVDASGLVPGEEPVSQTSFTLEVSCEDLGTCLPYAWLWLDTSCSSRLSGAALEVQVLWPAQVTLDASGFQYGDLLHLCTDWGAVAGARPGSDTGFSIFVSPVDVVSPLAIEARADQIISISCVAGCRSATTVHLASHSCDTSSSTRASRSALLQSPQRTAALDATDFQPGSSLLLCADMDGSGDTFAAGDTGVRIYVKGWASASMAIRAADAQQVLVSCLDCSAVTKIARAYVAEHCGRVQATEKTFPLVETTGGLAFLVDASMLTKGITARLCATLGEQTLPPFTDTALEIFVSPFSDIVPTRLTVGTGQIRLKCDHFVCPAETTWSDTDRRSNIEHLISQDAAEQLEVAAQSDAANSLVARFETSSLTAGRRYHVCIQVGTQPLGDTGRRIYLSNVSEVTPGSLRAAPAQEICFVCPQCSSAAMLRVAASCVSYNLCLDLDGAGPLESGSVQEVFAAPDQMLSSGVEPSTVTQGVDIQRLRIGCALRCSEVTQAYLATSCEEALSRTAVARYLERLASRDGSAWLLPVNVSSFESGRHYKICIDLDGPSPGFLAGDSGLEVYVNGVVALDPLAVNQAAAQKIRFSCPTCAATATVSMYLARSTCTTHASDLPQLQLEGQRNLTLTLNAQSLEVGMSYRLCVDMDSGKAGDVGEIYLLTSILQEPLSYPYPAGTLVQSTQRTLVANLFRDESDPSRLGVWWYADLQTEVLTAGLEYHLCLDLDGQGSLPAGDTGIPVFVNPVSELSQVVIRPALQSFNFVCSACEVCVTASVVSAAVPAATLLLSPVEEVEYRWRGSFVSMLSYLECQFVPVN
eukprot:g15869.t1